MDLSPFGPIPAWGMEQMGGCQGPSEDRDTQLRPGDQLQGDGVPVESDYRDKRAEARWAHQAEGTYTKAQRWERTGHGPAGNPWRLRSACGDPHRRLVGLG